MLAVAAVETVVLLILATQHQAVLVAVAEVLTALENAGCQLLAAENGKLIVRDPKHALTDALRAQIHQHKEALLDVLHTRTSSHQGKGACNRCESSDVYARGPVRVCTVCKYEWLIPCSHCTGPRA